MPACRKTTQPWRYAWPTYACTPTTQYCWPRWPGRWFDTEVRHWRAGGPVRHQRAELLRLAGWRASRSGLDDVLLNPVTGLPEPAAAVTNTLLDHIGDALAEAGDTGIVTELLAAVRARGNGAVFQRNAYRKGNYLGHVAAAAAAATTC